jgi:hypothetical protein
MNLSWSFSAGPRRLALMDGTLIKVNTLPPGLLARFHDSFVKILSQRPAGSPWKGASSQ